jgi:carbamoyltransferase
MYVLGLSGGFDVSATPDERVRLIYSTESFHDAAAVLLRDGEVMAGIEEERLSRVKHSNFFPAHAIEFCLKASGLSLSVIDHIAWYMSERSCRSILQAIQRKVSSSRIPADPRAFYGDLCLRVFGESPAPDRMHFVDHHEAHAASAFLPSPFDKALVVTLDGAGDDACGTVSIGEGPRLRRIATEPVSESLGHLYHLVIETLGYRMHDEYKVMGLAPYGDPERFRGQFDRICTLRESGRWQVHFDEIEALGEIYPCRREHEPITQLHMDVAAALQEALERAALHHLEHHRRQTGLRNLCLAGGVAHNSVLVGRILESGLFDSVFVQPAAGDAGCALGAALSVTAKLSGDELPRRPLSHMYWGTDVGQPDELAERLQRWSDLVDIVPVPNAAEQAAKLLAQNHIIGWAQGRSEFGPRALGNRSILADPRPVENKDRINALVKHREAYRPFAPAVLEEYASQFFKIPIDPQLGFMTTVVEVLPSFRSKLGAITHVDGSARIQTVSRTSNPRFWELIDAFRRRTGTPIVLNTSFNHSVEPIVDSIDDVVVCFLTTGLTYAIIGDYLLVKSQPHDEALRRLRVVIPRNAQLMHLRKAGWRGATLEIWRCEDVADGSRSRSIASATYDVLARTDGVQSLGELMRSSPDPAEVIADIRRLWSARLIALLPSPD